MAAAATLKLALTLTQIPAYPEIALHTEPNKKLSEVKKAIEMDEKYSLRADLAGISLKAYKKNNPIDVKNAYLNIVPY